MLGLIKRLVILFFFGALSAPGQGYAQNATKQFNAMHTVCRQLLLSDTAYATEQSFRLTDDVIYTTDGKGYYQSITKNGSWNDLDYKSNMRGSWRPSWHLYRLMLVYREYKKNNDNSYLQAVHNGMAFWIKNDFKSDNWWHNNINVPFAYSTLLIMLGSDATQEEKTFMDNVLSKRIPVYKATGQNLLWQLDNEARMALLHNNDTSMRRIVHDMQEVITVSTKEGIQPDYSFHQHGPMLQFGNYGFHFINTLLFWMRVTANTTFAFDADKQNIIFNYCSKGLRWTIYKGAMDVTAVGRQIRSGYTAKRGIYLSNNFNLLKSFDKTDACKYYISGFNNKNNCKLIGNKSFWRSDYMIHLSADKYMMSVKTEGAYVNKVESINTENLKGAFLNDGVCLIHNSGKEYTNIEPLWNWDMLPGTTCDTTFDPSAAKIFRTKNTSDFVGQISNGNIGISSMSYKRLSITAYKSWFFINDMVVALGAGITSADNTNVVTTVDQKLLNNGSLITASDKTGKGFIWQGGTAYFFPDYTTVKTNIAYRQADWKSIDSASDKIVADSVLSIYIPHNNTDHYTYMVKPGISINEAKKINKELPIKILMNSKEIQAVQAGNTTQAVLYQAGSLQVAANIKIETNKACLFIYTSSGNNKGLWVADPTRKLTDVIITINGKKVNVVFPKDELAGSVAKAGE